MLEHILINFTCHTEMMQLITVKQTYYYILQFESMAKP